MFTVIPHVLPNGTGVRCGTSHCRVSGDPYDGKVWVQEMKLDGGRWRPRMCTLVAVRALVPLCVQVDLFGEVEPAGGRGQRIR